VWTKSCENFFPRANITKFLPRSSNAVRFFAYVPFVIHSHFYTYTTGTLARINIRDELMPYRYVIGQVILEKNKRVRTVVCKKGMIESEFRTLPLEIVAGDNNTIVTTIEHGTKFRFDYRTVYWNSRLGMEHHRIVKEIEKRSTKSKDKVVCDMFCGVGPFAIPAAKQGLEVLANDLNAESVKYLRVNTKLNKVETRVECFNKDGREFVRDLLTEKREFQYVLMNLPAIAIEFLDVFRDGVCDHFEHMPRIYCYCFSKESTVEGRVKDVIKRAEMALNISSKDLKDLSVRDVRDVAPQKMYMCIEFELPRGCKTSSSDGRGRDHEDDEFPKSKRMKVESDDGQ
jgi:tRNA (guanine37-N1)-methyltransferase